MKKIIYLLILMLFLVGCSGTEDTPAKTAAPEPERMSISDYELKSAISKNIRNNSVEAVEMLIDLPYFDEPEWIKLYDTTYEIVNSLAEDLIGTTPPAAYEGDHTNMLDGYVYLLLSLENIQTAANENNEVFLMTASNFLDKAENSFNKLIY